MRPRFLCLVTLFLLVNMFTVKEIHAQTNSSAEQKLAASAETIGKILDENIIPFWYPQTLDRTDGGYQLNHDVKGKFKGRGNKRLVTQARTVWFFSRLVNAGVGADAILDAAQHGYAFLRDRMWDQQRGGFFWEVDSTGGVPTMPDKHLYGQAFALYAISEYALASGDPSAESLARQLFSLLEYIAHDKTYGGYQESFRSDWIPLSPGVNNYMSVPPNMKLMNTHLHLMEALTTYYTVTRDAVARERLIELINIQSNSVVRKMVGACTDKFTQSWSPVRSPSYDRVSYGHDLENIWLLYEACEAAGINNGPFVDLYNTLFHYSLQYGYDSKNGGFYDSGGFRSHADRRAKVWWVQSEALVSALTMYRLTGEEVYLNCFLKTLDWIEKKQVDWKNGDWHSQIGEDGKPAGDKAGSWKSPYHNGRAMIQCLQILPAANSQ